MVRAIEGKINRNDVKGNKSGNFVELSRVRVTEGKLTVSV